LSELNHLKGIVFVTRKMINGAIMVFNPIRGKLIAIGPGWDYSSMRIDYQLSTINYQDYIDDPNNSSLVKVIAGYDDVIDRVKRIINEDRVGLYADNELIIQYVLDRLNLNSDLKIVPQSLEKNG
jgi:polar amino acid transport system substrate-binding protein